MHAVVTGAAGFLGRRLVKSLCEDGCAVRCLVRPSSDLSVLREELGPLWRNVEVRRVALADTGECRSHIEAGDVVFHLAAGLTGGASTLFLNTVVPTRTLLRAASDSGARRFVLVSSLGVYGTTEMRRGATLTEESPLESRPHLRDPYTYSKVAQEQAAREFAGAHGLPLVIVRPGVIFGPGRGVLSSRVGLQFGTLLIRMGGRQTLPYTYVDNCAAAIRQAGFAPGIDGEALNIVDDDLPTAAQLVRRLARRRRKPRSVWVPGACIGPLSGLYEWYHWYSQGQVPGVITRYRSAALWKPLRYSNAKARRLLGWRPAVSFDEAFERSLPHRATIESVS
jgi:nucleoside-diphosphate-sugar epimerase